MRHKVTTPDQPALAKALVATEDASTVKTFDETNVLLMQANRKIIAESEKSIKNENNG